MIASAVSIIGTLVALAAHPAFIPMALKPGGLSRFLG
jgi:hypothetical protein